MQGLVPPLRPQVWNASNAPPLCVGCRDMPPLAAVTAHPGGASPYGVLDLVGNVFQVIQ